MMSKADMSELFHDAVFPVFLRFICRTIKHITMKKTLYTTAAILIGMTLTVSCSKKGTEPDSVETESKPLIPIMLTKAEQQVASSANAFAFDSYRALYKDEQMFVSPFSLSLALSMTACGADGKTAEQMTHVLGFDEYSTEDVASYYNKMVEGLKTVDDKTTFESANSIWIDHGFNVKDSFLATVEEHFAAEAKYASFADPSTLTAINKWCSDNTHGKIEHMLERISPDCVMAIINAIYFNGQWTIEFNDKTSKEDFMTLSGEKVRLDMMSVSHLLNYSNVDGWTMVQIPYGNGAFSMSVILPPEETSFRKAAETFTFDRWNSLSYSARFSNVNLRMPEFKFEYDVKDLKNVLTELGMSDAFTGAADFSKMADIAAGDALFIGDVKQKTSIEVNKKGTVAAGTTVVEMGYATALPPNFEDVDFIADRPFFFLIHEATSNSILFIGQKVN